jgi:hypothetical protein
VTDQTPVEVKDELGVVARFACTPGDRGADVHVVTPRIVLTPGEAAQVLAAIERATADATSATIVTTDAALRAAARAIGFGGGLRAPLVRDGSDPSPAPVPTTIAAWLPDAEIEVRSASPPRRVSRFLATGLDRTERVTARRDGVEIQVVTPLGPDALLEAVAATVDTLLTLSTRLGAAASRMPPISFSLNGPGIAHGRVAGANFGGGIVLSPMYVDGGALARIRKRRDAVPWSGRTPRRPRWSQFAVDLVVVHEVGHSVDQAERSGRLSDVVATRRALGESVGVESVELALRSHWLDAPDAWRAARARIVDDLSEYATTNCVELFAEAFVAWYLREESPIAGAMDSVLRARYPDLP